MSRVTTIDQLSGSYRRPSRIVIAPRENVPRQTRLGVETGVPWAAAPRPRDYLAAPLPEPKADPETVRLLKQKADAHALADDA